MKTLITWYTAARDFLLALTPGNILIVLVLCVAFGATGWLKGVSWEKARIEAATAQAKAKEAVRQDTANDEAKAQASAAIDALQAEITRLNAQLEENENEAHQDPAAAHCGISSGGVQRLNKIR